MVKRCKDLPPAIRRLATLFDKVDEFGPAQPDEISLLVHFFFILTSEKAGQYRSRFADKPMDRASAIIAAKDMSSVANVERKIRRVEGFRVRILHLSRADVRGDRSGLPQYGYHRAAENDITVETWKTTRFRPSYPGFEVDVVDRRGNSVQGNTKLETVRKTYEGR